MPAPSTSALPRAAVLAALIAVCGCGSGGGGGDGDGGGGDDDAPRADAAGPRADGGGGGGDDVLWPLAVGRSWEFEVATFGGFPVCASGRHSDEVLGAVQVRGRDAFELRSFCPAAGVNTFAIDGDEAELDYQGGWIVVLDVPVEDGHTWTSTGPVSYTWRAVDPVSVPAGTFDDCWMREQNVTYTAYSIFCRGVGMVRDYSEDLAGSGWDAQLAGRTS